MTSTYITIHVHRAVDFRPSDPTPPATIVIDLPQGDTEDRPTMFDNDARMIADALYGSLPGGTLDALLRVLLVRRASQLRVPQRRVPA